jgi:hypothetical protein
VGDSAGVDISVVRIWLVSLAFSLLFHRKAAEAAIVMAIHTNNMLKAELAGTGYFMLVLWSIGYM